MTSFLMIVVRPHNKYANIIRSSPNIIAHSILSVGSLSCFLRISLGGCCCCINGSLVHPAMTCYVLACWCTCISHRIARPRYLMHLSSANVEITIYFCICMAAGCRVTRCDCARIVKLGGLPPLNMDGRQRQADKLQGRSQIIILLLYFMTVSPDHLCHWGNAGVRVSWSPIS